MIGRPRTKPDTERQERRRNSWRKSKALQAQARINVAAQAGLCRVSTCISPAGPSGLCPRHHARPELRPIGKAVAQ